MSVPSKKVSGRVEVEEYGRARTDGAAESAGSLEIAGTGGASPSARRTDRLVLPDDTPAAVEALALDLGAGSACIHHAVWVALLGRYCQSARVCFGIRVRDGILPWVVDLDESRTAAAFVTAIGRELDLLAAEPISAELVAQAPAYETTFEVDGPETAAADTVMSLRLHQRPDGRLELVLDAEERAVPPPMAQRILRNYARILAGFLQTPELPVAAIPHLDAAEHERLVTTFNRTEVDYPRQECIHTRIRRQVTSTPDRVAVASRTGSLTYRELHAQASALASRLVALGVGPDDLVAICLDRSPALLVGILGVLEAGGAYLPIDLDYPQDRIEYTLQDSRARVIVSESKHRDALSTAGRELVLVDEVTEQDGAEPTAPTSANLAYVIYTSGSTGKPKGVMVEHRNVANFFTAMDAVLDHSGEPGTWVAVTSISFDISVLELLWTLGRGFTIVLHDGRESIVRLIEDFDATHFQCTPSQVRLLLAEPGAEEALGRLSKMLVGGEACPPDLGKQLCELVGGDAINVYGPTETCIWSTSHRLSAADSVAVPIGRPIANTRIYLLDPQSRPVPQGVSGELCIGGAGVVRGYFDRPELTAERFVADPFRYGERIYRTGDLARYREDGTLDFLGRNDFQVKLRGHRIELGEIEASLLQHDDVAQAVVIVREDTPGDLRMVAYVVASNDFDAGEVRAHLEAALPSYMVPNLIVRLDALPLTPNGKIDRKALPVPQATRTTGGRDAATETERELLALWQEVLGTDEVGVEDDFFRIGGHSLLIVKVLAGIQERLQRDPGLGPLFEHTTIAALAVALDELPEGDEGVVRHRGDGPVRATFGQQSLWYFTRMSPDIGVYNDPLATRLVGPLDTDLLRRAIGILADRHEAMRTVFAVRDGQLVQVVQPSIDLEPVVVERDLAGARAFLADQLCRPFDLEKGPLVRWSLVRIGAEDHMLGLDFHHAVIDGHSVGILRRELIEVFEALSRGEEPALPELQLTFSDYAASEGKFERTAAYARQLDWWREQLSGQLPVLDIPADRPRPPVISHRGASIDFSISQATVDRLREVGARHDASLYMVLLAAYQVVLRGLSGQGEFITGTPITTRSSRHTQDVVGMFVDILPLRIGVAGDAPFEQLLEDVRDICRAAFARRQVPFERMMAAVAPNREATRTPIFQTMFALDDTEQDLRFEMGGLRGTVELVDWRVSRTDLTVWLLYGESGLMGQLEFSTDLFDQGFAERVVESFACVLESVIADDTTAVAQLPLLPAARLQELLAGPNDTARSYPEDLSVHGCFEQQVDRAPDAIALRCGDVAMTYAELDARANALARRLAGRGVGPDTLVGVMMERSPELLVALLGILKAGAAYLPLDPAYPASRTEQILEDAGIDVMVVGPGLGATLSVDGRTLLHVEDARHDERPGIVHRPDRLSYVIYTSGSTGRPKGVMLEHRNVLNLFTAIDTVLDYAEPGIWLAVTSMSFDISVLELFWTLGRGFTVVLRADDTPVTSMIVEHGATHLQCTPSQARMLLAEADADAAFGALRKMLVGGEALPADLAAALAEKVRGDLINVYGPTETCVWSTSFAVGHPAPAIIPIGRAFANTKVYVLDERLAPVPQGAVGELYIGGAGVARGYLNRPELTAARFLADPFDPSARIYRTGDLARFREDGTLEFRGRNDHQVKLRGHRIELGEIEAHLRRQDNVDDAVVVLREDTPNDQRLVAYVVVAGGFDEAQTRAALAAHVPSYMVPNRTVRLDALPKTPNGKIDRLALPAPGALAGDEEQGAPRTATERTLLGIWRDVLGADDLGVRSDFFLAGGHSLLAVAMFSKIEAEYGLDLPLTSLLQARTVADMAALVDEELRARASDQAPALVAVQPSGDAPPIIWIGGGERTWDLEELARGLGADQPLFELRWDGPCPTEAAARSLECLRKTGAEQPQIVAQGPGARVATELSRLASQAGEPLGPLVLVDPPPPARLGATPKVAGLGGALAWLRDLVRGPRVGPLYAVDAVFLSHGAARDREAWRQALPPGALVAVLDPAGMEAALAATLQTLQPKRDA